MPLLHMRALQKGFRQSFNAHMRSLRGMSMVSGSAQQQNACFLGRTAVLVSSALTSSFAKSLSSADELEGDTEAASTCLQEACSLLMLPFPCTAALASAVASHVPGMASPQPAGSTVRARDPDQQNSASKRRRTDSAQETDIMLHAANDHLAGNMDGKGTDMGAPFSNAAPAATVVQPAQPSSQLQPSQLSSQGNEIGTSTDLAGSSQKSQRHASRVALHQAGTSLQREEVQAFQSAWGALLAAVMSMARSKPSLKKEHVSDLARQMCRIVEGLPLNKPAQICLQLASSAASSLVDQVSLACRPSTA